MSGGHRSGIPPCPLKVSRIYSNGKLFEYPPVLQLTYDMININDELMKGKHKLLKNTLKEVDFENKIIVNSTNPWQARQGQKILPFSFILLHTPYLTLQQQL